jgi:hypothetical protein
MTSIFISINQFTPRKAAAKAKLKAFLGQLGAKAQDTAFALLERYLESKLGI